MPDQDWTAVLSDLEQRLALGEGSEWLPPEGVGPLPPELAPRALKLLAAQQGALRRTEAELDRIGRKLTALRRPAAGRSPDAPAYVDTMA